MKTILHKIAGEMGLPISGEEIDQYGEEAPDEANIKPIEEFEQELIDHILMPQSERGALMPWRKTHDFFRVRRGELTIWTGEEGKGKSSFLNQVILALKQQEETSCICSFEMKVPETLERMVKQWTGTDDPSVEYIKKFFQDHRGAVFFYDQIGSVTTARVLAIVKYCAIKAGINHIIIDSLMKCGIGSDDYALSEVFVNDLQNAAKDYGIGIHLVAHQNKGGSVRGSGMLTDIADNVWEISKDEEKAEKVTSYEASNTALPEKLADSPDFYARLKKQRHSSVIVPRTFGFWGHKSLQFVNRPGGAMNEQDWMQRRWQ